MTDRAEQRATMVHAPREEPGSYARMPEDGAEVIYRIRPSGGGLAAGWERTSVGNPAKSQEEEFPTLTPTPSSTSENFDAPLDRE